MSDIDSNDDSFYDSYDLLVCISDAISKVYNIVESHSFVTLPLSLETSFGNNGYTMYDAITNPKFSLGFKSAQVLASLYNMYLVDTTNLELERPRLFINIYQTPYHGPFCHPLGYDTFPTQEEFDLCKEYIDILFAEKQQLEIEEALNELDEEEIEEAEAAEVDYDDEGYFSEDVEEPV